MDLEPRSNIVETIASMVMIAALIVIYLYWP